jgi:hypothetical protein
MVTGRPKRLKVSDKVSINLPPELRWVVVTWRMRPCSDVQTSVLSKVRELVNFGRRQGYQREEIIDMIQAIPQ